MCARTRRRRVESFTADKPSVYKGKPLYLPPIPAVEGGARAVAGSPRRFCLITPHLAKRRAASALTFTRLSKAPLLLAPYRGALRNDATGGGVTPAVIRSFRPIRRLAIKRAFINK